MYPLSLHGDKVLSGQGLMFEGSSARAAFSFAGTPLPSQFHATPVFDWTVGPRTVQTARAGVQFGESSDVFTTSQSDVGHAISASMQLRFGEVVYSAASTRPLTVLNVNDLPSGALRIAGDSRSPGSLLTAVSSIADQDGMGALSYQWRADGQPIAGATGPTLTLGQGEAGKTMTVVANYVDGFGQSESVASDADPDAGHVNTPGSVRIAGRLAAGQTLHAELADPDHAGTIYYQWQVAGSQGSYRDVDGAWGSAFTLGAELPAAVRVQLAYADRYGVVEARAHAIGTEGADVLRADAENETVMALGGDDIIGHLGRGHRIDGGPGLDTFVTHHARYQFWQTREVPGQWAVADIIDIGAPILLTQVERVHFSNGRDGVALDYEGHAGQAYRLYGAAFDRTPDKLGQGFWMNRLDSGVSLIHIAEAFVASNEFRELYGANPSNADIVARLYQHVLNRAPDADGRFWVDVLDSGRASVAEVLVGFSESAEHIGALVGVKDAGIDFTPYTAS